MAALFLGRLDRPCHLERRWVVPPDAVVDPRRLVCKAIFSTHCDCVLLGWKAQAEQALASRYSLRLPSTLQVCVKETLARFVRWRWPSRLLWRRLVLC